LLQLTVADVECAQKISFRQPKESELIYRNLIGTSRLGSICLEDFWIRRAELKLRVEELITSPFFKVVIHNHIKLLYHLTCQVIVLTVYNKYILQAV